ncbi:MAG: hypothetical protein WA549_04515 [Thermoplasmata archaeon]
MRGERAVSPVGILVGFVVLLLGVLFALGSGAILLGYPAGIFPIVTLAWLQFLGALATIAVGFAVLWLV